MTIILEILSSSPFIRHPMRWCLGCWQHYFKSSK